MVWFWEWESIGNTISISNDSKVGPKPYADSLSKWATCLADHLGVIHCMNPNIYKSSQWKFVWWHKNNRFDKLYSGIINNGWFFKHELDWLKWSENRIYRLENDIQCTRQLHLVCVTMSKCTLIIEYSLRNSLFQYTYILLLAIRE